MEFAEGSKKFQKFTESVLDSVIRLNFFPNKKLETGSLFLQEEADISPCSKQTECI